MPTSRVRRNKRKFARLHAMTGHRSWRCSAPGDSGLALWNKHAVDCVYEFVVREVNRTSLLVRFEDEDEDFEVMPATMPVVTAGDEGLMERLREECRLMWSELFSDASGDKDCDSGEEEDQENDHVMSDSGEDGDTDASGDKDCDSGEEGDQENDDIISDGEGRSVFMHDTDASGDKDCDSSDDDDKPLLKFDAVHCTHAKQRLRLCRIFVDAGESDGSGSEFSSAGF